MSLQRYQGWHCDFDQFSHHAQLKMATSSKKAKFTSEDVLTQLFDESDDDCLDFNDDSDFEDRHEQSDDSSGVDYDTESDENDTTIASNVHDHDVSLPLTGTGVHDVPSPMDTDDSDIQSQPDDGIGLGTSSQSDSDNDNNFGHASQTMGNVPIQVIPLADIPIIDTIQVQPAIPTPASLGIAQVPPAIPAPAPVVHGRGRGLAIFGPARAPPGRERGLAAAPVGHGWGQAPSPGARGRGPAAGAVGRGRGRGRHHRPPPPPAWNWSKINPPNNFQPRDIPLSAQERVKVRMGEAPSVTDFFHLYVSNGIIDILVEETNRFAAQYRELHRDDIERGVLTFDWYPVDVNEMKTFIALVMLMGIHYLPETNLYWSTDELYYAPIYGESMCRDRWKQIMRFWHFNNNEDHDPNDPERDRLFKIRKLIDCLRGNCAEAFEPGKDVCVDESLLLFKGRLHFRQYIRTKRARYGIKFYELCSSDGVLLDFVIYCGTSLPEIQGLSSTETIVATLMDGYLHEGRCVFLDNYYTSPNLGKWLLSNDTYMCGTVKPNRKQFPKDLANDAIDKGQSIFYECDAEEMVAVKFRSLKNKSTGKPKVVHLLSTAHDATTGPTGKKDKDGNDVIKPKCVLAYTTKWVVLISWIKCFIHTRPVVRHTNGLEKLPFT